MSTTSGPMRDLTRPQVWAPRAARVAVVIDGRSHPLTRQPGGWWHGAPLPTGTRYAFTVDGGPPLPDPRSLSQPDGVHGPSEIVDPALFTPSRPSLAAWPGCEIRGSVIYELHVGTFTPDGTLDAAARRLDHLLDLGVQTVELMPIAPFPGNRGWGYDGVAPYAVHAALGGPAALVRFIDAAHERGLAVLLDVVHNHLGPEGNYLPAFGPYFTGAHPTPWGAAINLDQDGSDQVRTFLLGSARQWLVDFGADGLRLDAVHALHDDSPTHFLAELAARTQAWEQETGRRLTLIAESDLNQPRTVSPLGSTPGACGMDAQWADDVHHALHSFLTGERGGYYVDFGSAQVLAQALTRVFVHDGGASSFRGRDWGAPIEPGTTCYDGHSFVVFLQNHDQVGNRAAGDRIGHEMAPALQAAGAALYLLSAYTPMVFMGEEWAASTPFPFFSSLSGELGHAVKQRRRREFAAMAWEGEVPDPQDEATRDLAVLRWAELADGPHSRMLAWYRRLIALRSDPAVPEAADPSLTSTRVEVVDADTAVMRRGRLGVAVTRAPQPVTVDLGEIEVLAAWDEPHRTGDGRWLLPGPGVVVFRALGAASADQAPGGEADEAPGGKTDQAPGGEADQPPAQSA